MIEALKLLITKIPMRVSLILEKSKSMSADAKYTESDPSINNIKFRRK